MLMDADVPKSELATIRTMSTGAAPVDPTVVRAFQDRYGKSMPAFVKPPRTANAG